MPSGGSLISLMMSPSVQGVMQFPDSEVYRVVQMLKKEDRPQVPVRFMEDATKRAEAFYSPESNDITVNRASKSYKDAKKHPQRLAAVLAHEGMHQQQHARGEKLTESPAYKKQHQVLQKLGERDNTLLLKMMRQGDMPE
jgi:hypothetical protein